MIQGSRRSSTGEPAAQQQRRRRRRRGLKMAVEDKEGGERRSSEKPDGKRGAPTDAGTRSIGSSPVEVEAPSYGPSGNGPAAYLARPAASLTDATAAAVSKLEIIPFEDNFGGMVYVYLGEMYPADQLRGLQAKAAKAARLEQEERVARAGGEAGAAWAASGNGKEHQQVCAARVMVVG